MTRVVVVGGGVLGTMHALEALRRGHHVLHLERDPAPRGASVRNFGLIWVSGRAVGRELTLALRARERWEEIGRNCPDIGFRANGSMTIATEEAEVAVFESVMARSDAATRGLRLLEPEAALRINPALGGASGPGSVRAALHCTLDAAVEPRLVLGVLRESLAKCDDRYEWRPRHTVTEVKDHAVIDDRGGKHEGDLIVLCPGANHRGVVGAILEDEPVRKVRLQMCETDPLDFTLTTSLADGDSVRYYPGFDVPERAGLGVQSPVAADWEAQLLLVQRQNGSLTIGDTHQSVEPFDFDVDDTPTEHFIGVAERLLGASLPPVRRRWAGVYSQITERAGDALYLRCHPAAGVVVVTGPGGRGMTLSPAIAEETFA